jgi:hypothetical protein
MLCTSIHVQMELYASTNPQPGLNKAGLEEFFDGATGPSMASAAGNCDASRDDLWLLGRHLGKVSTHRRGGLVVRCGRTGLVIISQLLFCAGVTFHILTSP